MTAYVRGTYLAAVLAVFIATFAAVHRAPQASPVPVAAQYVKDVAATNGLVVEGDQIQAVRTNGDSAVVLVKVRFHQVLFGISGPTVVETVRVREVRSGGSWSVTTLDEATA